jgi:hypothetical protein
MSLSLGREVMAELIPYESRKLKTQRKGGSEKC